MSDLFKGQTMTEAFRFISAGTAHTFTFHFQPDKVVFNNLSAWFADAGGSPVSVWFRDQSVDGEAFQQQVIDSAAAASFNFVNTLANGFTVADTEGGVLNQQRLIDDVTATNPVVVTTTVAHGYQDNQIVRITDLGSAMPVLRGMDQINNKRFLITVLSATTFSLQDVITGEDIDGTGFTAYVEGGRVVPETRVLTLNNPQVSPYSSTNPYQPNPFTYDPVSYQLTAGTAVMGANDDVFLIEVYKWGQLYNLGDLLV